MPSAYYNEIEPFCAEWLQNLMRHGLVAPGDVDTRSIEDVRPDDLRGYDQCHFFAGIGIWSYALRRAGWPDSRRVWTGSCPCQPFSSAGQGRGLGDERHLWPAWYHLIGECRPPVLLGEQVANKGAEPWLDLVHDDLEVLDYAFGAIPFPAAGVGAPHIRDRLYWVAHANECAGGQRGTFNGGWHPGSDAQQGTGLGGSGGALWLADGGGAGLEGCDTRALGHECQAPERGGCACGLEYTAGRGTAAREQPGRISSGQQTSAACGLADDDDAGQRAVEGLRLQRSVVHDADGRGPLRGFWADVEWIPCRDGKWRPVEPGTFPLSHGSPARVGRLRAYGNSLCAPAAQAFIEVAMGCLP